MRPVRAARRQGKGEDVQPVYYGNTTEIQRKYNREGGLWVAWGWLEGRMWVACGSHEGGLWVASPSQVGGLWVALG
jgi:hypothetical protein